jgi:hypothetical protein
MLGDDGFIVRQAALQQRIVDQQREVADQRARQYRDENGQLQISQNRLNDVRARWNHIGENGGESLKMQNGAWGRQAGLDAAAGELHEELVTQELATMDATSGLIGDQLGSFTGLLGGMNDLVDTAKEMSNLTSNFDTAAVMTEVADFATEITGMWSVLNTTFGAFPEHPINEANWGIWNADKDMEWLTNHVQNNFLNDFLPDVWGQRIATARLLQDNITMLASEIATINTMMTGIPAMELRATIDDIEDQMSIVEEFTKVSGKPLNLTFKLDIHMSAKKMAKAILSTEEASYRLRFTNPYP